MVETETARSSKSSRSKSVVSKNLASNFFYARILRGIPR